jgi:hypothetical protein
MQSDMKNWDDAATGCRELGGDLAAVTDIGKHRPNMSGIKSSNIEEEKLE